MIELLITADTIRHTSEGFVLVYDSPQSLARDAKRLLACKIDGLVISEDILIDGKPLDLETKQRIALQCFRGVREVEEAVIAWAVYRDQTASHDKVRKLMGRLSEVLRPHNFQMLYQNGVWILQNKQK